LFLTYPNSEVQIPDIGHSASSDLDNYTKSKLHPWPGRYLQPNHLSNSNMSVTKVDTVGSLTIWLDMVPTNQTFHSQIPRLTTFSTSMKSFDTQGMLKKPLAPVPGQTQPIQISLGRDQLT
jgi:hypothetical protein